MNRRRRRLTVTKFGKWTVTLTRVIHEVPVGSVFRNSITSRMGLATGKGGAQGWRGWPCARRRGCVSAWKGGLCIARTSAIPVRGRYRACTQGCPGYVGRGARCFQRRKSRRQCAVARRSMTTVTRRAWVSSRAPALSTRSRRRRRLQPCQVTASISVSVRRSQGSWLTVPDPGFLDRAV